MNDTIIACATPAGYSSIAVVRLSGSQAMNLIKRVFISQSGIQEFLPNQVYYGRIMEPDSMEILDYVLVTFFFAPHSYTGEDVIEISCHGNPLIVERIINSFLKMGTRLAEPGEFTRRALLNNKLDLIQAEAVLETVNAPCDEARKLAIYQLEGKLSSVFNDFSNELVNLLTIVEANIDFPEDEDVNLDKDELIKRVKDIIAKVDLLISGATCGIKLKQGYRVVIAGRPNVGKSTLFNRILGYERAIVHETPGTTRDFIEEEVEIEGILVRLIDTAGFFLNADGLDRIATSRSEELLKEADLILLLFDGSEPINEQDTQLYNLTKDNCKILVINKADLNIKLKESEILPDAIKISALTGYNIEVFKKSIRERLFPIFEHENVLITRKRHIEALKRLKDFLLNIDENKTLELIAFELHNSLEIIGELTGRVLREDILKKIFEEFCIGK